MNSEDRGNISITQTYYILAASPELNSSGLIARLRSDPIYEFIESTDLTAIKELLKHQPFDLILIQNDLPGLELTNLVIQARSIDPDVQVVVISRKLDNDEERSLWKSGIDDVVLYPATEAQCNYRLARSLKMRRLSKHNNELTLKNSELWKVASTDSLTKLLNRNYFTQRFEAEFARVQRFGGSLGCIITEIDDFERINEEYGREIGDQVLKSLAQLFRDTLRKIDTIARFSETEFIMLLPETIDAPLKFVAEKLQTLIEKHDFRITNYAGQSFGPQKITLCMGLVSYPDERVKASSSIIDIAEAALIHAQAKSNNQIEVG